MASDDQAKKKELEQQRLLAEIQKRAEEAELKRIEEEERRATQRRSGRPAPPAPKPDEPAPPESSPPEPPPPAPSPKEERLAELHERIAIALDRGKGDRAGQLIRDLESLSPGDTLLTGYRKRLERLLSAKEREEAERLTWQQDEEEAERRRRKRKEAEDEIARLLQNAESLYLQEKYDRALAAAEEALVLNGENRDALSLKESILRAQELAKQIREEEDRRRATEVPSARPASVDPSADAAKGDVWGEETAATRGELGDGLQVGERRIPQRVPVVYRVVERVSRIRIPVKPLLIGAGVLVLVLVVYFVIETIRTAVFPPKYSLLVLPAVAADGSLEYVAEGLTDYLISDLSAVQELRVVAASTALSLPSVRANPEQLAKSMGASYYLVWSVGGTRENIRLQIAFHDTLGAIPRWSEQLQSSMGELPTQRLELARRMVDTMGVDLSLQESTTLSRLAGTHPAAFDACLRGRSLMRRGALIEAQAAFEQALALDPTYMEAHSALAWVHLLLFDSDMDTSQTRITRAWAHVRRAVETIPVLSESYRSWGLVEQFRGNYESAVQQLTRGVSAAPSDAESQRRLAVLFLIRGMPDEALRAAEKAAASDSRNVASYQVLGMIRQARGEFTGAFGAYEEGLRIATDRSAFASGFYADVLVYLQQPDRAVTVLSDRIAGNRNSYVDYYKLARVYQTSGRPKDQWQSALLKAKDLIYERMVVAPDDAVALALLALVQTRLGEFRNAAATSSRALSMASANSEVLYATARMYALQGEKEKALEFLTKAIDRRYRLASVLDMDFYNLRSDPDFQQSLIR